MAISIDWPTKVITVPQADLTFVTGTLYEMDTNQFRKDLNALQAGEHGIAFETTHLHNTEVTVAGTTFFRTIEIINGYSVQFTPNSQWSVRLIGSNNNIFDVENGILVQNQVQVIPSNSGGGIVVEVTGAPQRNEALPNFGFYLVLASDHVTPATGKSPTVEIQRDTGSFIASTNTAAEISDGFYRIDLTAAEMDGGTVNLVFTAADSDQAGTTILTAE